MDDIFSTVHFHVTPINVYKLFYRNILFWSIDFIISYIYCFVTRSASLTFIPFIGLAYNNYKIFLLLFSIYVFPLFCFWPPYNIMWHNIYYLCITSLIIYKKYLTFIYYCMYTFTIAIKLVETWYVNIWHYTSPYNKTLYVFSVVLFIYRWIPLIRDCTYKEIPCIRERLLSFLYLCLWFN